MGPDLLLDALSVHRLTRLVTRDVIAQPARERVIARAYEAQGRLGPEGFRWDVDDPGGWDDHVADDPNPPRLATLVSCRWCAGTWVAAGVVAARLLAPRQWAVVARALALSSAGTFLARLEDD